MKIIQTPSLQKVTAAQATLTIPISRLWGWTPKFHEVVEDMKNNRLSHAGDAPILVSRLDTPRGAFFMIDGYHRVVEAAMAGKGSVQATINPHIPRIERSGGGYVAMLAQKAPMMHLVQMVMKPKTAQVNQTNTLANLDQQIEQALEAFGTRRTRANLELVWDLRKQRDELQSQLFPRPPSIPLPPKEDNYKGEHESPDHENGAPLHNLSGIFPDDFYTGNASQYGQEGSYIASFHNRPNAPFMVYRAIPKALPRGTVINKGDWVTLDRRYAVEHGQENLRNEYRIISKRVFARDLFTDGNSFDEWGYDPHPRLPRPKTAQADKPNWYFEHPDYDPTVHGSGSLRMLAHYIRMGDFPTDAQGQPVASMNALTGVREPGISVYAAYFDPVTKKYIVTSGSGQMLAGQNEVTERPAYLVEGTEIDQGDDGEPCLDPKTVKIVGRVDLDDMVYEQDKWLTWKGTELQGDAVPDYRQEHAALFPENVPLNTPQQRAERSERQQMERDERHQREAEEYRKDHQQKVEMAREVIRRYPEYKDAFMKQYPELANG